MACEKPLLGQNEGVCDKTDPLVFTLDDSCAYGEDGFRYLDKVSNLKERSLYDCYWREIIDIYGMKIMISFTGKNLLNHMTILLILLYGDNWIMTM